MLELLFMFHMLKWTGKVQLLTPFLELVLILKVASELDVNIQRDAESSGSPWVCRNLLLVEVHRSACPNLEGGTLHQALSGRHKNFVTVTLENQKGFFLYLPQFQTPRPVLVL